MICPFCRHDDSRVVDSRPIEDGTQIRRRRECPQCGQRFSTQEVALLNIIKRSGATQPFSREKVLVGVRKACQGRPVNEDDLILLAQRVEETLRSTGQAEIEAQEVGMAILAPLRELDEVAYLRYASVYRNFTSLEDFEGEIALLRAIPSSANSHGTQQHSTQQQSTQQISTEKTGSTLRNSPITQVSDSARTMAKK
jgi:transcriptional repressor NrdR